jgi:soluble lytic murein transglycosylase-like protein
MRQVRARRLAFSLLTSAAVVASVSQIDAEVIVFTNGRMISVKDHRIAGESMTVTFRDGGEATFRTALVARIAPDEVPEPVPLIAITDGPFTILQSARRSLDGRPFATLIESVALKHGIDPALVHAVVAAESNYQPAARSQVGARGLMQVMPSTARDLGVRSAKMLLDPEENLEAGVKYLKWLLERFDGDLTSAVAAYNAGPGAVQKYDGIPPFPETENYVKRVLSKFQQ